jgi:DNA-binding GntR family transcriptional regulator
VADGEVPAGKVNTTEDIMTELKARIHGGRYSFGQRLIEMDLAAEFGAGRGRIREAFRMLVGEGYLEFVANRGVLVRRYTREEMIAIGRVREVLEGLAARLAAENRPEGNARKALEASQERMDAAEEAGDLDLFNLENRVFHSLIEDLAGNDLAGTFIERVRTPLVRLQLPRSFAVDSMTRSNLDHRTIAMAIISGSPDAAEAAMRAHVRAGNEHIASLPDEVFQDAGV